MLKHVEPWREFFESFRKLMNSWELSQVRKTWLLVTWAAVAAGRLLSPVGRLLELVPEGEGPYQYPA